MRALPVLVQRPSHWFILRVVQLGMREGKFQLQEKSRRQNVGMERNERKCSSSHHYCNHCQDMMWEKMAKREKESLIKNGVTKEHNDERTRKPGEKQREDADNELEKNVMNLNWFTLVPHSLLHSFLSLSLSGIFSILLSFFLLVFFSSSLAFLFALYSNFSRVVLPTRLS